MLLSIVARDGHQEDNNDTSPARRWQTTLAVLSKTREHPALVLKTVLEIEGEGGMASGFQPQLEFVAFWAGIG